MNQFKRQQGFKRNQGFTLAELLISLAILGVIATFTIPKILTSSQNGQNTAIAKEVASMISAAYSTYTLNNGAASTVKPGDLTQYFNYVSADATSAASAVSQATAPGVALNAACSAATCLKLHNGGVLQFDTAQTFGGTSTTHAIYFNLDPDGTGPQGRISFVQYYNGRLTTGANALPASTATGGTLTMTTQTPDPSYLANWN